MASAQSVALRVRAAPAGGRDRLAFVTLLVAMAMMNVAYTMLIPLVPDLTTRFAMSALLVSAAFSGFALTKALAQPLGGLLVDRLGRPGPHAFVGLLLTAAAIAVLASVRSGTQIVIGRLVWGLAEGATFPALYRLVTTLGPAAGLTVTRAMGWLGASAVAGMASGPAVVGLFHGVLDFAGVFRLGAVLTLLSGLLLLVTVIWRRPPAGIEQQPGEDQGHPRDLGIAGMTASTILGLVLLFGVVDLVNNGMYAALEPVIPLHLARTSHGSAVRLIAVLFMLGLLVFALVSATCGRLIERVPLVLAAAAGLAVAAGALVLQSAARHPYPFGFGFLLFMTTQPVLYVVARRGLSLVPQDRQGRAFGLFGLLSDVGFIVGPPVGVALYDRIGGGVFGTLAAGAGVTLLGLLVAGRRINQVTRSIPLDGK